jgi:hypothetical protein
MKIKSCAVFITLACLAGVHQAPAQGTAFTYQGQLNAGGSPANGSFDLAFSLFDTVTGGTAGAGPITNSATVVSNGLFTVTLDFGAGVFTGVNYWLDISVSPAGSNAFTELTPRQPLTATPYALYSPNAGSAANAATAGTIGGVASGNVAQLEVPNTSVQATGTVVVTGGLIARASVTSGGAGYTTAPPVTVSDVSGSNAVITATVSNRAVVILTVQNGGSDYSAGPTVTIAPPPSDAYQTFNSVNIFNGINTFSNAGNTFAGSFTGNGGNLTNLSAASLTGTAARLSVGSLTANSNIYLPATTAAAGIIYSGSSTLIQSVGTDNFFAGIGAGNLMLTGGSNTGIGADALHNNTTGTANTATGEDALHSSTTGYYNTAIGFDALGANTTGYQNTASGLHALQYNTTGSQNTATGDDALEFNTTGSSNTANGFQALLNNTSASYNAAYGYQALLNNTTASYNTANGSFALYSNTIAGSNTADGSYALYSNTSGNNNTAIGSSALGKNSSGANNIALGYLAGSSITTGSDNIDIGSAGVAADNKTIHLGTQGVQANTFIAGIYGGIAATGVPVYVSASGQLGTLTSSARFKQDIKSMDNASDVLLSLHPVTFHYKSEIDPNAIPQFGLVAEEVEKVDPDLVARDDTGRIYTVRYEAVNAMLLNEFLKQHRQVEEQRTEIESLKQSVAELRQLVGK